MYVLLVIASLALFSGLVFYAGRGAVKKPKRSSRRLKSSNAASANETKPSIPWLKIVPAKEVEALLTNISFNRVQKRILMRIYIFMRPLPSSVKKLDDIMEAIQRWRNPRENRKKIALMLSAGDYELGGLDSCRDIWILGAGMNRTEISGGEGADFLEFRRSTNVVLSNCTLLTPMRIAESKDISVLNMNVIKIEDFVFSVIDRDSTLNLGGYFHLAEKANLFHHDPCKIPGIRLDDNLTSNRGRAPYYGKAYLSKPGDVDIFSKLTSMRKAA